ncbi:MAG: AAA family ATPase [Clostridia bacterium]|nr:AAA family ATPase [Clostridia bacterium]
MENKINMIRFVENQCKERYKNFILFGPAMSGKTKLAKKLADKMGAKYIDLLEEFAGDINLKAAIDTFEPYDFKQYIKSAKDRGKLIIIDNMDFLFNTWDSSQRESFFNFVEMDEDQSIFCLVLQDSKLLKGIHFRNSKGQKRVLSLYDVE